jgi:hypothetical protein
MTPTSMNKLILNSILCGALALGTGATSAFAKGNATLAPEVTPTEAVTTNAANSVKESKLTGDIHYLFKSIVIKLEIALTDDNVKQAELLTLLTQERIKKAEMLLAQGKTNVAVEALQNGLDDQDRVIELKVVASKAAAADASANPKDTDSSAKDKVTDHVRNNIEALTRAMEKVKNPTAKAALARNIEKSKAKLAERMQQSDEPVDEENNVKPTLKPKAEVEVGREKAENEQNSDHKETNNKADKKENHEQLKQERKLAQAERKATHEKVKEERKAAHEIAKEDRK